MMLSSSARPSNVGAHPSGVGLALALAIVWASGTGCVGIPEGDLVVYDLDAAELAGASVGPEGDWESMPWSDPAHPWLPYPPRGVLQLEHALGYAPRAIWIYLAFDAAGTDPGLAAGDLARIVDSDEETLTFRNDTNGSFFVRVVAR